MKKKIFCIIISVAVVVSLCLPCLALAEESPKMHFISATDTSENGITLTVSTWITEADWQAGVKLADGQDPELIIEVCDETASNVPSGSNIVVSFKAYTRPSGWIDYIADYTYDIELSGGRLVETINEQCAIYIQYPNGKTEYLTGYITGETFHYNAKLFSILTLVDGWPNGKKDNSKVSPKTDDAGTLAVLFGTVAILVAGSVAYVTIRHGKKADK